MCRAGARDALEISERRVCQRPASAAGALRFVGDDDCKGTVFEPIAAGLQLHQPVTVHLADLGSGVDISVGAAVW